ncbi:NAD(P)H-quinone oxidoreductase subunit 3 [Acidipropionibacterium jensenii]|uniref:NADH-quinone oxidoreductase subunit n=3 Tax=Acidipropionibacterium jensenii TaxID=1749 RepID=A0A3S4W9H9_9ACTN|nr:NADH-quinone oxidoreductase subunit A [Acidipropionibacterium jensenii]VEI03963.1 NAD(P)H-quinone oxidoreductase subunit 3 [Acidipropionibacterium jensenii]
MNPYIPLVSMMMLAALFVCVMIGLNKVFSPTRHNASKHVTYECGIEPTPQPVGGGRFPVKYYVVAMLFIVFDIEIVFLYPWAVSFNRFLSLGAFAVVEMVLFIVTVFVSYIYVYRRRGLDWD